jgi:hypothetical protein
MNPEIAKSIGSKLALKVVSVGLVVACILAMPITSGIQL